MFLERTCETKALSTSITQVRFIPRVGHHVLCEGRIKAKAASTNRTQERLLACMATHVVRQVAALTKTFTALLTGVRSFSRVNTYVFLENMAVTETFPAFRALVQFLLHFMRSHMSCIHVAAPERLAALFASLRGLSNMCAQMPDQLLLARERFLALPTRKSLSAWLPHYLHLGV
jgi:hypothetical protein